MRDITLRALDILKQVDVIVAEDTRVSRKLLSAYDIHTPLKSYHDFNKERITPLLINLLKEGQAIALISDAGTPGISDPAFYIVREAIRNGLAVEAIPGATAFVPALILSGLPTDRFVFEGFLPAKKGRSKRLEQLRQEDRTIIFYEAPHRLLRTLRDIFRTLGDRQVAVSRELTKKFEQVVRGRLSEVAEYFEKNSPRGEFVIVVHGIEKKEIT
ncbi:16S rRNA (cytidine(1402)-2'-O)-methyltransferase [candidate division KSB1 bacterium RBG_16_48_16]|nr:MAG: 16S rRNA (cytidine(1402)-2'-O)-methyltransferase [candidate division KSB1 bacterium RBG_16_48_16]